MCIRDRHYDEDLSLKDLANLFFITPTYLSKWFKDKTGATITQFVENLRMERARELLEYTSLSVGEIGRRVGYEDSNYFSRVFKKIYGIPPIKWPRICLLYTSTLPQTILEVRCFKWSKEPFDFRVEA